MLVSETPQHEGQVTEEMNSEKERCFIKLKWFHFIPMLSLLSSTLVFYSV